MFGDSNRNTAKTKLYRNPSYPGFVKVESVHDHEYIHAYDEDRNLLNEGIYRYSWSDGQTALGSRLFRRDEREESRIFKLHRFSNGDIYYYDKLAEKPSYDWKTLVKYKFNPDNLTWTKQT